MSEALSDLATLHVVALVVISLVAGLVQGALGFGFAIVSVPLLMLLDPRLAPVPQILAALPLSGLVWWREREHAEHRAAALMTLGRVPGTYLGYLLLLVASAQVLDFAIGTLVLLAVVVLATGKSIARTPRTETAAGVFSGVGAYVGAIGGPPVALLYEGAKGATARATLSLVFVAGSVVTLIGRYLGGALGELDLWLGAVALPSTLAGLWVSGFVKDRIEGRPMRGAVLVLCSAAALALFGRALRGETVAPTDAIAVLTVDQQARAARRTSPAPHPRVRGLDASSRVEVVSAPGALPWIAGRIIDGHTREGLPEARILVTGAHGQRMASAGADGAFRVELPEPGVWALTSVRVEGYRPLEGLDVRIEGRPDLGLDGVLLAMEPVRVLHCTVRDASGAAIPRAEVRVLGSEARSEADETGELDLAAEVDSVLMATAPDGRHGRARVDLATDLTGRLTLVVEEALDPPLGRVEGRVLTAAGEPLAGAPVTLRSEAPAGSAESRARPRLSTRSGDGGVFAFPDLPPGRYTVEARVDGAGSAERRAVEPGSSEDSILASEGRLSGSVRDSGGAPVPAAVVRVERVHGDATHLVVVQVVLDPEGHFAIGGLFPGRHRISAVAPAYAPSLGRDLDVVAGESAIEPLVLSSGGALLGSVTDGATGEPLGGATVVVEVAEGSASLALRTVTDDDGEYRLLGVGPASRALAVSAAGHHVRVVAGVSPVPGRMTRVDVALTPVDEGDEPRVE